MRHGSESRTIALESTGASWPELPSSVGPRGPDRRCAIRSHPFSRREKRFAEDLVEAMVLAGWDGDLRVDLELARLPELEKVQIEDVEMTAEKRKRLWRARASIEAPRLVDALDRDALRSELGAFGEGLERRFAYLGWRSVDLAAELASIEAELADRAPVPTATITLRPSWPTWPPTATGATSIPTTSRRVSCTRRPGAAVERNVDGERQRRRKRAQSGVQPARFGDRGALRVDGLVRTRRAAPRRPRCRGGRGARYELERPLARRRGLGARRRARAIRLGPTPLVRARPLESDSQAHGAVPTRDDHFDRRPGFSPRRCPRRLTRWSTALASPPCAR